MKKLTHLYTVAFLALILALIHPSAKEAINY
jgi:hypothetical protein